MPLQLFFEHQMESSQIRLTGCSTLIAPFLILQHRETDEEMDHGEWRIKKLRIKDSEFNSDEGDKLIDSLKLRKLFTELQTQWF